MISHIPYLRFVAPHIPYPRLLQVKSNLFDNNIISTASIYSRRKERQKGTCIHIEQTHCILVGNVKHSWLIVTQKKRENKENTNQQKHNHK